MASKKSVTTKGAWKVCQSSPVSLSTLARGPTNTSCRKSASKASPRQKKTRKQKKLDKTKNNAVPVKQEELNGTENNSPWTNANAVPVKEKKLNETKNDTTGTNAKHRASEAENRMKQINDTCFYCPAVAMNAADLGLALFHLPRPRPRIVAWSSVPPHGMG